MTINAKFLYEQTMKDIDKMIDTKCSGSITSIKNGKLSAYKDVKRNMTQLWEAMLETEKEKSDRTRW